MLDLIRHFLFFNPCQRWSADTALRHVFFSETDEPEHTIVPSVATLNEPVTPPDHSSSVQKTPPPAILKDITPLDLLPIPQSPYQICPDWNTDHPVSRHGRLCSAVKDDANSRLSSSRATHVDRFLHDTEPAVDNNAWLTQSRPIYSSHQKVHPVTDRPNSSHIWNKYNYAAHQQLRPSTPAVEHVSANKPSASTSTNKRYSYGTEEDTHSARRLGHHHHLHHHHHHPHHNDYHHRPPTTGTATASTTTGGGPTSSGFSIDRIPHYGNQLIKWAPPHFPHHHHQMDHDHDMIEANKRPESRQCRTPAPFSSSIMKHKYTSATINTNTSSCSFYANNNALPIKPWTPATTTTTVNTDKILADGYTSRISDKPQSTHRNSTSHRFNLWVPKDYEDEDDEDEDNEKEDHPDHNRFVFLPIHQ